MRHLSYAAPGRNVFPVCILVTQIQRTEIEKAYLTPYGIDTDEVMILDLHQSLTKKKTPVTEIKEYILSELVPTWEEIYTEYIICTDAEYFKALTKLPSADKALGYVVDCVFGPWKVVYAPSQKQIFFDPERVISRIGQAINALIEYRTGSYQAPGHEIIKFAEYLEDPEDIERWLIKFVEIDRPLACDIEAFDLRHTKAGIGTISFAWSQHEGIAFPVDLGPNPPLVRALLAAFFRAFKSKLLFHGIAYDAYIMIYQLFMEHILDTEGLLDGLDTMLGDTSRWECTKLIAYLATNSCAGNNNSLKFLAQEFAGNYAVEEIQNIRRIPLPQLLEYNLVDSMATWFVYNKYHQTMIDDQQQELYEGLFKQTTIDIIQMQLTGLPIDMKQVKIARAELEADERLALDIIEQSPIIQQYTYRLNAKWVEKRNSELKVKRVSLLDANETFNPNSGPQLQDLLYEMVGLPIIDVTKNKQPATGKDTLKALLNHTKDADVIALLNAMVDYADVNKILTSFIPAFENAALGPDGWHYLFGNFNLGGTISGRLSSSDPNLQNIPATGSKYAKIIKLCFVAPPGWLFAGLDFDSLEDKISALTSKDPNKIAVYQGHIVYELDIDGVIHHIRDDSTVNYDGKTLTGQQFYDWWCTNSSVRA